MSEIALKIRVTGRVQGVAYRAWTKARAEALGLTGRVMNDQSGAVLAHLQGAPKDVDQMVSDMWTGPGAAVVRDVQHQPTEPENISGFEIRR